MGTTSCGGGTQLARVLNDHSDHLGSPVLVTDQSGVLQRTSFRPYGEPSVSTGGIGAGSPAHGFTGHEYDAESGLYYMRARYYDPTLGRFSGEDPAGYQGSGLNAYAYVDNQPTVRVDPTGRVGWIPRLFRGAYTTGRALGAVAARTQPPAHVGAVSWVVAQGYSSADPSEQMSRLPETTTPSAPQPVDEELRRAQKAVNTAMATTGDPNLMPGTFSGDALANLMRCGELCSDGSFALSLPVSGRILLSDVTIRQLTNPEQPIPFVDSMVAVVHEAYHAYITGKVGRRPPTLEEELGADLFAVRTIFGSGFELDVISNFRENEKRWQQVYPNGGGPSPLRPLK